MHIFLIFTFLLLSFNRSAAAKAVFAHFMVDNTEDFTTTDWTSEIYIAKTANIDAFALNIASGRSFNDAQISNAFTAANAAGGFKLFFSFDYASKGAWDKATFIALLREYVSNGAYFHTNTSQPLVSTFEGPSNAADWTEIKSSTGCFFIPDWSSYGAKPALELENGVADGLFSWAAWPYDGTRMKTYIDASYLQYLSKYIRLTVGCVIVVTDLSYSEPSDGSTQKPYMMAASPWFYTNLPGFGKNWAWPDVSMSLWSDRWTEILLAQPDYVEIISWNDYGESHYIGNTRPSPPFQDGDDTFDYVTDMSHEPWRWPLAIWAEQYKTGKATVTEESFILEYLLHSPNDCSDGGTTINTASQYQIEDLPVDVLNYKYIGVTAVLGSAASVTVTVGGQVYPVGWQSEPAGGVGVYHGSVYITSTGAVSADLIRNSATILTVTGEPIGGCTTGGYANFNPFVAGDFVSTKISAQTPHDVLDLVCTQGSGAEGFTSMCLVVCEYGYCPIGGKKGPSLPVSPSVFACYCTALGLQKDLPKFTGDKGYAPSDPDYDGLCAWTYQYGFTFPEYCSTTQQVTTVPATSPFNPKACTGGQAVNGDDGLQELCAYTCSIGYCPVHLCSCTSEGALVLSVPDEDIPEVTIYVADINNVDQVSLCNWACNIGHYCSCQDGDDDPPCDLDLTFTDLGALADETNNFPTYCAYIYMLDILYNNVTAELAEYNDANAGYDSLFGYYTTYIKDEVPGILDSFMGWSYKDQFDTSAPGQEYFECAHYDRDKKVNTTVTCPPFVGGDNDDYYWTLINSTGFYADLQQNYGISPDWVILEDKDWDSCVSDDPISVPCSRHYETWHGYPQPAKKITVTNPKDLFTAAGPAMNDLPNKIVATRMDMTLGQWGGSGDDVVQAFAMPVAMISQAIQAMKQVKVLGKKEEDAEKKKIILLVLTAVIGVVPFVGEIGAATAGLGAIATTIAIAGLAANAALDIYTIVEDPSSAPMTALGLLFGVGGLGAVARDAEGLAKIAALRRTMSGSEVVSLGATVDEDATFIQRITKSCAR
ncbi:alpha-13-glucanase mutanase protein [Rutstroemia sp. NJR-2017a BVV2]|nr:alpha-13-glucanase mutanase protein [Rutstroemia sp. NJR-2017a BVV2]